MAERPENRPIRVGVHGIGDHAERTVLPAVAAAAGLELAGISTRNADKRGAMTAKWTCPGWASLAEMLSDVELDAVFVASPIGCHFEDGRQVLAAGVHLWSEKSFTRDVAEAENMLDLAAERDLAVCVSLAPAYHSQFQAMHRLISTGAIGRLRDMTGHFGFPHVARERPLYDPALGGGALRDIGYYPITILSELAGEMPSVAGARLAADAGYQVDTEGAALLAFPSGVQATAEWGYGRDYINELTIVGETGTILAKPAFSKPGHLEVRLDIRRQNAIENVPLEPCNQFVEMLGAFARATATADGRRGYRTKALDHQRLLAQVAAAADDNAAG
jgi:NDP-hexose-3-ketoreductase